MGFWRLRNITRGSQAIWPTLPSIQISNSQPCSVATASGSIVDVPASLTLDNEDEIAWDYSEDGITYALDLFAGDVSECVLTYVTGRSDPRMYQFTAQDFTARLGDNVIDAERLTEESVTARVDWIMGFSTRGITAGDVATITDLVDGQDYRGMTVSEALAQVAGEVDASFYVDFDKSLHFFINPPAIAAPFELVHPASPPTSYPFWDFSFQKETDQLAEAVYVIGDGVTTWRGTQGTYEVALRDDNIKTLRKARRRGDRLLATLSEPVRRGSATLMQPGLKPLQTVRVVDPTWAIDDSFIVVSTTISAVDPNGPGGGSMRMDITFSDRFQPCSGVGSNRLGADGPTGPGDGDTSACVGCARIVTLLPSGMDSDLALAHGALLGIYVYDGTTLVRYRCNLRLVWSITPGASNPLLFGHEAETYTPVLVSPRAYRIHDPEDPAQRWDITTAGIDFLAAQTMDAARFWQVVDKGVGEIIPLAWRGWSLDHVDFTSTVAVGGFLQPGDVAVVMASNGVSTAPSLAAGFTNIGHRDQAGGSSRIGYRVLQAGDTGSGVWSTATNTMVAIYRGLAATPIGAHSYHNGSVQPKVPALATSGGWIVAMASGSSSSMYSTVPTGLTGRSGGFAADAPSGSNKAMIADTAGPSGGIADIPYGSAAWTTRTWSIELSIGAVGGGGGGIEGPALQRRAMQTGDLLSEVALTEATTQIRRTPNGQNVFVLEGTGTFTRYDKQLGLRETTTIAGFTTGLQDWNVDDDYNIYKLVGNVLTKYNRDGEELWSVDLFALKGYRFPTRTYSEGTGHAIIVDEHVRVAGYIGGVDWTTGSKAALLSVSRRLGGIRSVQRFGGDNAQAIAVHRAGNCLYLAGAASGSEFEDVSLGGLRGWIMRIPAALAD